jgi:aryl-alcohol dehydrogenase-like predicted oxidoreductase
MVLVDIVRSIVERKGGTPAQTTLARLLAQRPWIVPISEPTKVHRLGEHLGTVTLELTADGLTEIGTDVSKIKVQGERLPDGALKMTGR